MPDAIRRRPLLVLLLLLAGLPACSDDAPGQDATVPDAAPCGPGDATPLSQGRVLVATEQYGSGGAVSVIDLDTLEPTLNVALTTDDVTLRWFDHRIWVINRYGGDNIMILADRDYHLQKQFSVRPAPNVPCNPHDLLFLSTCRAVLSCYAQPAVYLLDPTAPVGQERVGEIDLSSLADDDGLPEVSHLAQVGSRVFATVQRLARADGWVPVGTSYVAILDPEAQTLTGTIALESENPGGPLVRIPGTADLLVAGNGAWDGQHAGLERIHTDTDEASLALSADALGGIPTAFTVDASGCGFALITAPESYDTGVVRYCLEGAVQACVPLGALEVSDVALTDDGRLLVTDRAHASPGVRIYDSETCEEETTAPISTGFAPGFTDPLLLIPPAD